MKVIGTAMVSLSIWAAGTLVFAFFDWCGRDIRLPMFHYVMEVIPWTTVIALIVSMFWAGMELVERHK